MYELILDAKNDLSINLFHHTEGKKSLEGRWKVTIMQYPAEVSIHITVKYPTW